MYMSPNHQSREQSFHLTCAGTGVLRIRAIELRWFIRRTRSDHTRRDESSFSPYKLVYRYPHSHRFLLPPLCKMKAFAQYDCWYDIGLLAFTHLLGLYTFSPSRIAPPEASAKAQSRDTLISLGVVRTDAFGRLSNFAIRTAAPLWSFAGLCAYGWSLQSAADKAWIQQALRVGCAITIVGFLGRLICYHTLGKFFTFNLAVHSDHKVRHVTFLRGHM